MTSSEDGSPLPSVSVLIKGSTKGVTTDGNGVYKISTSRNATLNFSFIGFATQSVNVSNRSIVDVQLKADAAAFNEVVVTAQGIRKNVREIGYAYSKVATEDIKVGRSPQLAQALAGKVTGLEVYNVNNSGLP